MSTPTIPTGAHLTWDSQILAGAGGPNSVGIHSRRDDQSCSGVDGSTPAGNSKDDGSASLHEGHPPGPTSPAASIAEGHATQVQASLVDPFLALCADMVDDLEKVRIANENRLRQLTRSETDADGLDRGFGLDESHRDVARVAALVETLCKSEHQATLDLNRKMRAHPLGAWVAVSPGVGEKQAARLLAALGDPAWNNATGTWASLRELWSFAGYGDAAAQVRRRGQRNTWNADAKMRTYLMAVSCVKVGRGPYRAVYDEGRARYDQAVHESECKRCGPAGHPAQPGSALSAGHQHARAIRLVCKALLRDLWREARRLHGFHDEEEAAA